MPKQLKSDLRFNRLRKVIAGAGGSPLVDFQKFSMSGYDHKGQISSGFGEHLYGAKANAKIDFGKLILPGFLSLKAGVKITAELGDRSMLILQRDQSRARRSVVKPGPKKTRSHWKNTHPINLMVLRGDTMTASITTEAGVSLGANIKYLVDETGASISADAKLGGVISVNHLVDNSPRHYSSVYESSLNNDVDFLLNDNVKRVAALWVLRWDLGNEALSKADQVLAKLSAATPDEFNFAMKNFADQLSQGDKNPLEDIPLFSADTTGFSKWMFKAKKAGVGKWARPKTENLIKMLRARNLFVSTKLPGIRKELETKFKTRPLDEDSSAEQALLEFKRDKYEGDLEATESLMRALYRRKEDKLREHRNGPALGPQADTMGVQAAPATLDVNTVSGQASVGVNLEVRASVPKSVRLQLSASGQISTSFKNISYRYRTATAVASFQPSRPCRILSQQETTISYRNYLSAKAKVAAEFYSSIHGTHSKKSEKKVNFGTMVYHSAFATWRSTDSEKERVILPNGSGVTKGVSVLSARIIDYATSLVNGAEVTDVGLKLEEFLNQELNITETQLREFFKSELVRDAVPEDSAMLVEASFALDNVGPFASDRLTFGRRQVHSGSGTSEYVEDSLLALPPVKKRLQQKGTYADIKGSHLSVLRLRLRSTEAENKVRSVFSLGISAKKKYYNQDGTEKADEGDVTAQAMVGKVPSIFRRFQAGVENTFDFHIRYYEKDGKPCNDDIVDQTSVREFSVPPVALFNF